MDEQKPRDEMERRVRIICGALVGILLGAFGGLLIFGPSSIVFLATVVLGFGFAFLAVRYGDAFWLRLSRVMEKLAWFH